MGLIPELIEYAEDKRKRRKRKTYEQGFAAGQQAQTPGVAVPSGLKKGGKVSKKPRGCGAAQRGFGKAMKYGGSMKGKY